MLLDQIFYHKLTRATLFFLRKNFHQILTKNIDLTAYMQYLKICVSFKGYVLFNENDKENILLRLHLCCTKLFKILNQQKSKLQIIYDIFIDVGLDKKQ